MFKQELNAIGTFKKHTEQEGNWEEVKKNHLLPGLDDKAGQYNEELKALIKFRDIIDFRMYRKAVEDLFPIQAYNLETQVNGNIENQNGHPRFVASWYEFKVTKRAQQPFSPNSNSHCIIKVNAPGSRNLTSDIDTSIFTLIKGDPKDLLENAHAGVKAQGPDYAGRITIGVINGFYDLSEKEFGMTSAEHRDSNAYADLSTEEKEEYPKFQNNENGNPIVGNKPLFDENELDKKRASWKSEKHQLELAASLFSLRMALGADKWKIFVEKQVPLVTQECSEILKDGTIQGIENAKAYITTSERDLQQIFKLTEALFLDYENQLKNKKKEIIDAGYKPRLEGEAKERDIEIAALNRLYVEALKKMAKLKGKILTLKQENNHIFDEASIMFKDLEKEEKKLAHYNKEPDMFTEELKECSRKCSEYRKNYDAKIKALKDNYVKCSELELEKLKIRYEAHTFANEAYVCRSAVYHVVSGMQQSSTLTITEQTLLGSALQQIGFKLLHKQELAKRKKSAGEIEYRTAKYSQRVHHLLFNQSQVTDEQIIADFKSNRNRIGILSKFKTEAVRTSAFALFSKEDLLLLNSEMKIILEIKNNNQILEQEKYSKTEEFLRNAMPRSEEKFLSLASKIIASVYLSKFERRPKLWSEVSKTKAQITPMFQTLKEEQPILPKGIPTDLPNLQNAPREQAQIKGALTDLQYNYFKGGLNTETSDETGTSARTNVFGTTVEKDAKIVNKNQRPH